MTREADDVAVYSLSPHIVDGHRSDLIAAAPAHIPRPRRLPFGALRGIRLLRRIPRRAAA
jgi:hypothetical protein